MTASISLTASIRVALACCITAAHADGSLAATAPMAVARMAHTATSMPDGRVLIVGGFNNEQDAVHGAAMYEARTGVFTPIARMVAVRHSHTATLLPNGKVLIVGGYTAGNSVSATAELYDPLTNKFSATGAMHAARAGHVSALLKNGKVLIAGGVGPDWSFLASAELYDPATGAFTTTNAMSVARESHVAVALSDGRVLIVGGHRDRRERITIYASAEVFNPTTNTFKRVGDMNVRRHKHDAVLLADGRVLVSGGSDERDDRGAYNSTELFDPIRSTFTIGARMQRTRYKHQGTSLLLPNGRVLIGGGASQAEIFDPLTSQFSVVASETPMAGQFSAAALLGDGSALITGGYGNGTGPRASAWRFRQ